MVRTRVWTEERDAILVRLHRDRRTYVDIAGELGISGNAAAARIAVLIRRGTLSARAGKWMGRHDGAVSPPTTP